MRKDILIKLAALNIGIALFNILIFATPLIDATIIGGTALSISIGVTALAMSAITFLYGNQKLLNKKTVLIESFHIRELSDCKEPVEQCMASPTFAEDLKIVKEQIKRFEKKKQTVDDILLQKFNNSEMSYMKFKETVDAVCEVLCLNIKSILNKINAFDEDDYRDILKGKASRFSENVRDIKVSVCNEYIFFVKNAVENNEEILLKLDKLLLEISKYNTLEDEEIDNMAALKELDSLIENAKFYK